MIDIVICHTDNELISKLQQNIENSCGTEYSIHAVDNTQGKYDIFTAYQSAINNCNGDIIVCCHQDILFKSGNWGIALEKYFAQDKKLGAIGVAGATAHSKVPGSWMTAPPVCKRLINLIQHDGNGGVFHDCTIEDGTPLYPAAVTDGVFIAFRKEVFKDVSFCNSGMTGFHGYDIDISLQLRKANWKMAISSEILLEHFSMGRYSRKYIENIVETHRQHRSILPFSAEENVRCDRKYETLSLYFFACTMRESNIPAWLFLKIIMQNIFFCTPFCKGALLLAWAAATFPFRRKEQ